MSITLLRWKSGAAGDTVLKMLLESNQLHSQNRYLSDGQGHTAIDYDYVKQFEYDQIAQMSLTDYNSVEPLLLQQQLAQLHQSDPSKHWLLKTHSHVDVGYPVIDIVVDTPLVPFVVRASLEKNSREKNLVPEYHPMASKIDDPNVLYKFDCFNYSYDLIKNNYQVGNVLPLRHVLSGWDQLVSSVQLLGFDLDSSCQAYYNSWLAANQQHLPSKLFETMLQSGNYDYNCKDLSIEERYCFLVLCDKNFCTLS